MNQIVNPYIAGSPVTGPEMFFGRQDVFGFIRQTLTGKHRDQVIVLYGRRRTGKTSVLYQMRRHLSQRYLCIFVDLHGLALDGLDGFLWELANHIRRSLRREYQIELPRLDKSEFMADPRGQFEEHFLNQVWSETGECHVLLMLDEAVRIQEQVQTGKLEPGIFEYLRHLMQHYERLNFLFSLGSGLEEMEKHYALLFNVALYKRISFLERDAAVALITEPVQEHYEVAPAAVEHILDITSGHPYYTQLICHSVFNRWLGTGARLIGVEDIDDTLEEVVERGLAVLKYVWEESKPAEKAILAGMAAAMGETKQAVTLADITGAWSALDVTIPRGEAVKAIRSLTARDVIDGDNAYEFRVDLLHMWLLKYERLDWVREELAADIDDWQKIATAEQPTLARTNIPRWAAMPLLLTAAIVFCLLGVYFSSTVRDALPFLAFVALTDMASTTVTPTTAAVEITQEATVSAAETSSSVDDPIGGGEESAGLEEDGPIDATVQRIIDQEGRYFNDFNDYDPGGFDLSDGASIGKVDGEVAVVFRGPDEGLAHLYNLNQDSYELLYDLFLNFDPGNHNKVAVSLFMPDDSKTYKFVFGDELEVQFFIDYEPLDTDISKVTQHSLVSGWNKVRVVVDKDSQTVDLYTNGDHVITVDDLGVENTHEIQFEIHIYEVRTAELSAIDNVLLQAGLTSEKISGGEETAVDALVGAEESVSDGEGVIYFNDFNDYEPGGFYLDDGVSIGNVGGEVAVIIEGLDDNYADLSNLNQGSYELVYDLFLSLEPGDDNRVALVFLMPDDSLRYEFLFGENLQVLFVIDSAVADISLGAQHSLENGWNEVRVVVDKALQTVDLYTNGEHVITIDDIVVENTKRILFEVLTAELSAIDDVLLQAIASDGVSQGQLSGGPNSGTLQLDGESGYVEVPYAENLNLTEALTIEAWVNANARPSQVCTGSDWQYCNMVPIISQSNQTSSIGNYYLGIEEGFPVFGFETDNAVDVIYGADTIMADGWHHLATVHTFGQAADTQLYLDGEPLSGSWVAGQDMTNGSAYPNTGEQYLVGVMTVGGSAYYDGLLDELRIWNIARTESEIMATMMHELTGDEAGLASYWKFNEPEDETLARDSSKYGNDGILKDGAQFQTVDMPILLGPSRGAISQPPPAGGSGIFVDSGQQLGDSDSYVVALGDLDGDGDLDAFAGTQDDDIVWFNDGTGQMVDSGQRLGNGNSQAVSLGDFDSDGDLDAFVAYFAQESLLWLNNGDGYFIGSGQQPGSSGGLAVATGDVDGDGDLDVLVGNQGTNTVWINDGAGNFNESGQSLGDEETWAVVLADVDGDSDLDAFFGNSGPNELWLNDGAGVFENSGQSMGDSVSRVVAIGDLDGDGDLDAFITSHGDHANLVWLNDGNGRFSDSGQLLGALDSVDMALGDVDGDGDLDAFVANNSAQANRVWINDGMGIFVDSGQELGDSFSEGMALGDLDGDGDLDAFEANMESQPDRIWLNQD